MAVVIQTQALIDILDDMRVDADEINGILRLYQNDYTPVIGSVAGDFLNATFSGYTPYDFSAGGQNFPAAAADGSNNAQSVHGDIDFVHDGGGTDNDIYGWYMIDQAGAIICAERYAGAPFAMDAIGKTFTVTPTVKLKRP